MQKTSLILFFTFLLSHMAMAQFEDGSSTSTPPSTPSTLKKAPHSWREKINIGGGLDLQFGTYTIVGVTPLVAYKITDDLMAGTILTYRYFQDNRFSPAYSTSTYGVSLFTRYTFYKGLFAHVEWENLLGTWKYNVDPYWVDSFFVGGGYSIPLGSNGFVAIYLLYNVNEDPNNKIYANNPVLRFNFGIGF